MTWLGRVLSSSRLGWLLYLGRKWLRCCFVFLKIGLFDFQPIQIDVQGKQTGWEMSVFLSDWIHIKTISSFSKSNRKKENPIRSQCLKEMDNFFLDKFTHITSTIRQVCFCSCMKRTTHITKWSICNNWNRSSWISFLWSRLEFPKDFVMLILGCPYRGKPFSSSIGVLWDEGCSCIGLAISWSVNCQQFVYKELISISLQIFNQIIVCPLYGVSWII